MAKIVGGSHTKKVLVIEMNIIDVKIPKEFYGLVESANELARVLQVNDFALTAAPHQLAHHFIEDPSWEHYLLEAGGRGVGISTALYHIAGGLCQKEKSNVLFIGYNRNVIASRLREVFTAVSIARHNQEALFNNGSVIRTSSQNVSDNLLLGCRYDLVVLDNVLDVCEPSEYGSHTPSRDLMFELSHISKRICIGTNKPLPAWYLRYVLPNSKTIYRHRVVLSGVKDENS